MLNNVRIGTRLLVGVAAVLLVTLGLVIPTALNAISQITERAQLRQLQDLFMALQASVEETSLRAQTQAEVVASQPHVQRAFAERNREALTELTLPIFERMRDEYDAVQFQFLTAPATSFLRLHMLDRHGDDLRSMRETVVQANRQGRPVRGLERGVAGLGVRGVTPVRHQGESVGVVEFGLSFGDPFFQDFTEQYGVRAALHIPTDRGFETFAGTIGGPARFREDHLDRVMGGDTLLQTMEHQGQAVALYAGSVLDFAGRPVGVLEVMIDRSDYVAEYRQALMGVLGIGALVMLGGLLAAWFIARGIVVPLRLTAQRMDEIAQGDGDLTQRLPAEGRNELAQLSQSFNGFVDKIHQLVRQIVGASTQVAAAAEQLSATTEETVQQIKRQQSESDQVATAMNEMAATVQDVARNASEAAQAATGTNQEAHAGNDVVNRTIEAIETLANEVENAAQAIERVSHQSDEIGKVLDVIRDVAEQTNLLALNAAIEAARAGEQGRGFAVVADEVRTLASRTQESTNDIRGIIESLQAGTHEAVQTMTTSRAKARDSVEQAASAGQSLRSINQSVGTINDMNAQIASAAEEQSAVAEEINRNINNISHAVEQTATGSDQIARASEELARLAADLQSSVGRFRI
ncbi:methyl-accepting chemotaxis protein [Ectothiorhodospira variabilis]|uniref:methyl-accepting chemotaxis protein n=1 Tax=Ectothiorhodospira variabilis TaxID=505694 RepID=UPI001EFAE65B|nr:methyl-accepting chemotaxis protein [Ectothiorhodospira variabilis]MCG5498007.1 methyl-accepting chemotaxis protein [Ectothiorhodospira variabilis]